MWLRTKSQLLPGACWAEDRPLPSSSSTFARRGYTKTQRSGHRTCLAWKLEIVAPWIVMIWNLDPCGSPWGNISLPILGDTWLGSLQVQQSNLVDSLFWFIVLIHCCLGVHFSTYQVLQETDTTILRVLWHSAAPAGFASLAPWLRRHGSQRGVAAELVRHRIRFPATNKTPEIDVTCPLPPNFQKLIRNLVDLGGLGGPYHPDKMGFITRSCGHVSQLWVNLYFAILFMLGMFEGEETYQHPAYYPIGIWIWNVLAWSFRLQVSRQSLRPFPESLPLLTLYQLGRVIWGFQVGPCRRGPFRWLKLTFDRLCLFSWLRVGPSTFWPQNLAQVWVCFCFEQSRWRAVTRTHLGMQIQGDCGWHEPKQIIFYSLCFAIYLSMCMLYIYIYNMVYTVYIYI